MNAYNRYLSSRMRYNQRYRYTTRVPQNPQFIPQTFNTRQARRYRRVLRNIPAAAELRRYTRIRGRYVPHIWRNISRRL